MLDIPEPATWVLRALRAAGAADLIQTLAGRVAERAEFCCPLDIAGLLDELDAAGADAVRTLLDRDPGGQADTDDPGDIALLLGALRAAGAGDAARVLAARAADAGMFDLAGDGTSYPFGREPDGAPSAPWRWTEPQSGVTAAREPCGRASPPPRWASPPPRWASPSAPGRGSAARSESESESGSGPGPGPGRRHGSSRKHAGQQRRLWRRPASSCPEGPDGGS